MLSATQDCFLLNQEIIPDPILKQHPKFLFLSMVNILICIVLEPIINYTLQVPHNMLCSNQVNMSWIWLNVFTTKKISGVVFIRYIKDPII